MRSETLVALTLCAFACDGGPAGRPDAASPDVAAPDVNAPPVALFAERFGDAADQFAWSVASGADGSIVVAGEVAGSLDFGGGPLTSAGQGDVFVAKLDAGGHHLWSARFGDADEQYAEHVAIDASGDIAVIGSFCGNVDFGGGPLACTGGGHDVFVAVFDGSGHHLWSKSFGSPGTIEDGWGIAFDASGNVLVTGGAEGAIDFGGGAAPPEGEQSIFVAKLDPLGGFLWSKRVGDPLEQIGFAVTTDAAGDVLLTGRFEGTIDFGSGAMTAGLREAFVAAYDPSGNSLYARHFGDPGGVGLAEGRGIATTAAGVVVTGTFSGPFDSVTSAGDTDVFLLGLDSAGSSRFEKRFGDASFQNAWALAPAPGGGVAIGGSFSGVLDFGGPKLSASDEDGFVAVLDASTGAATSAHPLGGAGRGQVWGVATSAGHVLAVGNFGGTLDFGGISLLSSGGDDVFVGAFP